jgi:hypothetical protein
MTSANASRLPEAPSAEAAVARVAELSPDLRGCAVLGSDRVALAASGDPELWGSAGAAFLEAADAAGFGPAADAHVATEDGEAFAVRHEGMAMVAVAERLALASLILFDMRAALRDLAVEGPLMGKPVEGAAGHLFTDLPELRLARAAAELIAVAGRR